MDRYWENQSGYYDPTANQIKNMLKERANNFDGGLQKQV